MSGITWRSSMRIELGSEVTEKGAEDGVQLAVEHLLTIVAADREWNDQAARKQLLTVFEAAGAASPVARDGRRRLSSILFS